MNGNYTTETHCAKNENLYDFLLLTVMLEASAEVLPLETVCSALAKGLKTATSIAKEIQEMCIVCGKPKRETIEVASCNEEILTSMKR